LKTYIPEQLPIKNLNLDHLITHVGKANSEIARYDGLLQAVINPEILLSPMTVQEAVLSSKIEGTQASLDDVYKHEAGIESPTEPIRMDVQEILNYRSTLVIAETRLNDRPISLFLIRQMHETLMTGVRGQHKQPGRFRTTQNWIGRPGSTIETATFVPPDPSVLQSSLELFEKYLAADDQELMIQTALMHAQFEILHPFLDGNGRIGRLLIPLFLYSKNVLCRPMFYLSAYFENHRKEYYSRLKDVTDKHAWNEWIGFFLAAVTEQSKLNSSKVQQILNLYKDTRDQIASITRSQYSNQLLDAMFTKPVFRASDIQNISTIPKQSLMPMLKQIQDSKLISILRKAKGRTPAVYNFTDLIEIAESGFGE